MENQPNPELQKLGQQFSNGDAAAFDQIFDLFADKLFRYISLKIKTDDAEDILELTLLKAWENRDKYDSTKSNIQTWLFTIARNTIIDHYRSYKEIISEEEGEINNIASEDSPVKKAEQKLTQIAIEKALSELSEIQREVITLRYMEDLSFKEIAQILNKNEGTIRVIQLRALSKLKSIMKKQSNSE